MKMKRLAVFAAALLIVSTSAISQAEVTYEEQDSGTNITESFTGSTTVTFGQTPSFTVKIPKTITLDDTGSGKYTIGVKGQIPSKYTVSVVPDETITMEEEYNLLDSITADVTAGKTEWKAAELDPDTYTEDSNNTIQMQSIDYGKFEGNLNFSISAAIPKVELKDASDEMKTNNNFIGSFDTSYINTSMNVQKGDIIYTTYDGTASNGPNTITIKSGYYQCLSGYNASEGATYIIFGGSAWSYLGESYQV